MLQRLLGEHPLPRHGERVREHQLDDALGMAGREPELDRAAERVSDDRDAVDTARVERLAEPGNDVAVAPRAAHTVQLGCHHATAIGEQRDGVPVRPRRQREAGQQHDRRSLTAVDGHRQHGRSVAAPRNAVGMTRMRALYAHLFPTAEVVVWSAGTVAR